jgi:hypothetical protein
MTVVGKPLRILCLDFMKAGPQFKRAMAVINRKGGHGDVAHIV